jgi:NAD(P)-dependent dehydrogenase (short-subunit alcohol dehydrogenase family)
MSSLAVVTGAATGVGRALALEAAARGATVIAVDIDDPVVTVNTIVDAGGSASSQIADVRDVDAMQRIGAEIDDSDANVALVCANAGIGVTGTLQATSVEDFRRVLDVNVVGSVNTVQAFLPGLRRAAASGRASVLLTGSEHSLGVPPHIPPLTAYTTSKHALLGLAACLRRDLEPDGIGVSLLCPGYVRTERLRTHADASESLAEALEAYGQDGDVVARMALDGVERDDLLIPTSPVSYEFAARFHREVLEALKSLAPTPPGEPSA